MSCLYKTGGLEPQDSGKTMSVDGVNYVVSDKLRMMLRDSFIDWGTFLEVYHDNLDYVTLFDQMIRLLNIKENENLRESLIPLIKNIYKLPADAHMACMLKQFMVYEPVSVAIHSLFTTIKLFFEHIVEQYIIARNRYIELNNTKDKLNDLDKLKSYWVSLDNQYNLESSSIILLFLNPPNGIKSNMHFTVKGVISTKTVKSKITKFKYPGFCPKVAHVRLRKLLEFPINEFIKAIKDLDNTIPFPDFKKIENIISTNIKNLPSIVHIKDEIKRETPPAELKTDNIELAKWYVNAILELRKDLMTYGTKYEEYYIEKARVFININDEIKKELLHLH